MLRLQVHAAPGCGLDVVFASRHAREAVRALASVVSGGIGVPRMVTVAFASGFPSPSRTEPETECDVAGSNAKFSVVVTPSVTVAGADSVANPKALAVTL